MVKRFRALFRTSGRYAVLIGSLAFVVLSGAVCAKGIPADVSARLRPVQLEWWGVNETAAEVQSLLNAYRQQYPHVSITYRKFRLYEYERAILDALAEGDFRGPDIFTIPAAWTRRFQSKLVAAPEVVTMPFKEIRGSVKKETFAELRSFRLPRPGDIDRLFIDAVSPHAVLTQDSGQPGLFGLPLSADSLVLYSNRALLNSAGIPEPAKTWTELQDHVSRLTQVDSEGTLLQAGAAIGTNRNVQRSFDLLSLLMMQNGVEMADIAGNPTFNQIPASLSGQRPSPPAVDALLYYTDFARPNKVAYTWNAQQSDSLEAFLQGRVAYFFGYNYHDSIIRARAPQLRVQMSSIPHLAAAIDPTTGAVIGSDIIEGNRAIALNYADFWLSVVSERSASAVEAWDFLRFATTSVPDVQQYLSSTKRPAALRSILAQQLEDPDLGLQASQLLTARTWYRGRNPEAAEDALAALVDDVLGNVIPIPQALNIAIARVQQSR
jgi:ABC-type glycerol-3-phosphate transport system substrate-binding protein